MTEISSDLKIMRTLHSVDVEQYCGAGALAHWGEWAHKHERESSLAAQMHSTVQDNWPRFLRPGGISIDIGAYSGDTAIPMAVFSYDTQNHRRGTVIAVEPNPDVFAVLEINTRLNAHLGDFKLVAAAIAPTGIGEIEIADLGTSNCNMGIISDKFSSPLQDRLNEVTLSRIKVKGMSLAEVVRQHVPVERVGDISFIKIDCEGFDKEILLSSMDIIYALRPTIYTEWFALFDDRDSAELFQAIKQIDYVPLDPADLLEASIERRISDLMLVPRELMGRF